MRLRQLFGVEGCKFQGVHLRMRRSLAFLTCLSFLFVALRVFGCAGDGLVEPRGFFFPIGVRVPHAVGARLRSRRNLIGRHDKNAQGETSKTEGQGRLTHWQPMLWHWIAAAGLYLSRVQWRPACLAGPGDSRRSQTGENLNSLLVPRTA